MKIHLPEFCLVALAGPAGAGKSTFARRHFRPTEIVSSDRCRALVSDDENDMTATDDAFTLVHALLRMRLRRGRLTVLDATNLLDFARRSVLELSAEFSCPAVAIAFHIEEELCLRRNRERHDRVIAPETVCEQLAQFRAALPAMRREGFARLYELPTPEDAAAAEVERARKAPAAPSTPAAEDYPSLAAPSAEDSSVSTSRLRLVR